MKTVIEMAREVGFDVESDEWHWLERFADLVRADERVAMATEAAKQGWAMKNEDPFEDAVREIATIRARGNTC